ncbi:MAG: DNA repair protein RadC [Bacteroidales bacterium]|nr:DNA repair protein RadC [Bacteroidales bacterium]MBN2763769.1 DNA repair protein RadC [Bacteroidales bacterium]
MSEEGSKSIKEWAVEDRPREKLMVNGIQSLSHSELIAILIGSGTKNQSAVELARRILSNANNDLDQLGRFTVSDFMKIKGIGKAKAIAIVSALELGRRRKLSESADRIRITSSDNVFEVFYQHLADLPHEEFWILLLNRSNKIIDKRKISQGGIAGTVTDIRMILKFAIDVLASSIIVCHNHPSGNLQPSEADIQITRKIKDAATVMDIALLDHVIVAGKKYFSFADENLL